MPVKSSTRPTIVLPSLLTATASRHPMSVTPEVGIQWRAPPSKKTPATTKPFAPEDRASTSSGSVIRSGVPFGAAACAAPGQSASESAIAMPRWSLPLIAAVTRSPRLLTPAASAAHAAAPSRAAARTVRAAAAAAARIAAVVARALRALRAGPRVPVELVHRGAASGAGGAGSGARTIARLAAGLPVGVGPGAVLVLLPRAAVVPVDAAVPAGVDVAARGAPHGRRAGRTAAGDGSGAAAGTGGARGGA